MCRRITSEYSRTVRERSWQIIPFGRGPSRRLFRLGKLPITVKACSSKGKDSLLMFPLRKKRIGTQDGGVEWMNRVPWRGIDLIPKWIYSFSTIRGGRERKRQR